MNHIHEISVCWIQSHFRSVPLEIRLSRIQTRNSAEIFDSLSGITGDVGTQRMTQNVEILCSGAGPEANIVDKTRNFGADQTRVRRRLHIRRSCSLLPINPNHVEIIFDEKSLHHIHQPQITTEICETMN